MNIRRLVAVFAISLGFLAVAQAEEPDRLADTFIAKVQAGKATEAFDALYATNPWMQKSNDAIINLRNQLASLNSLVGSLRNVEKLQDITVGTRFRYMSYLAAFERQPVRFTFEFYKPEATWMLFSFAFDDDLDDDIEKMAKEQFGKR